MVANKHPKLFSAPVRSLGRLPESAPSWPRRRGAWIALVAAFAIAAAWPTPALTAGEGFPRSRRLELKRTQMEPVKTQVFRGDVRDLPKAKRWQPGDPVREVNPLQGRSPTIKEGILPQAGPDPLLERQESAPEGGDTRILSSPGLNFDGEPFTGGAPPDTVGDVGPNHYIQMVNDITTGSVFTVYDKSGNVLAGPTDLISLAPGAPCDTGIGDPIVLYDRLADRWLMSQMQTGFSGICLFISMTPDPVAGGWFVYPFTGGGSGVVIHDYPKWGIWPDAYFLTVNDPTGFGSHVIFAIDRALALGGAFSGFVITGGFPSPHLGFGFQGGLAPADLDGLTPPVVDAPGHFVRHWDDEVHGMHPLTGGVSASMDFLDIFEVVTGFGVPTFSVTESLVPVAEFDSTLCGGAACVPQPAPGVLLDTLKEPVMHRLQYRNFGTHETLVGNFTVDVGSDQAGIRWFELRRTPTATLGAPWALFQEGTHSPDATHRWMGSIAMDVAGNIALGYSASSTTVFPSIRYTGRESGDTPGTMTGPETTLIAGTGVQGGLDRWGDYSSMNVDPADDCTFWYTQEYHGPTDLGFSDWRTRIGTFKFTSCSDDNVGHFLCYNTKRTKGSPKFVKQDVSLLDQFENKNFRVKKPKLLCNPADKNGGGNPDPANHLRGYKIKKTGGQGKHVKLKNIKVNNQFGDLFVDTKKPDRLLVPTLKDPDNPVVLPDPFTPPLDHYKCYKVKRTKGTTKFIKQTVTVSDQFINTTLLVKKPKRLCVPVDKDGGGIIDPAAHLMCYKVKRVKKKVGGIHVNNQFGPEQLDTKKVVELCLPSTKTLP